MDQRNPSASLYPSSSSSSGGGGTTTNHRLADPVLVQRLYHAIDSLSSTSSLMQVNVHRDSLITHTMSLYKMRKDMESRLQEALCLALKDGTLIEVNDSRHHGITYFRKPSNMAELSLQRTFQHDPYCLACQRPSAPLYKCKRCSHSMHSACQTSLAPAPIAPGIISSELPATQQHQQSFICDACQLIMQCNNSDWDPEEQVLYLFHNVFSRKDFQMLRNVTDTDEALLRFFVMNPLDTEIMAGKVLLKKYRSGHHFIADLLHVFHTAGVMNPDCNSRTQESAQELLKCVSALLDEMNMCRECFLRNREGKSTSKGNRESITQLCAKRHRVVYCNYGASLCLPAKLLGHTHKGEPVIQYFGRNGKPEVISCQDYMSEEKPDFFGLQPSTSQLLSSALKESETYLRRLRRRNSHVSHAEDEEATTSLEGSSAALPSLGTPSYMKEIASHLMNRYHQQWKKIPSTMTKQLGRHYLDSLQKWTEHLKKSRRTGGGNGSQAQHGKGKRKRAPAAVGETLLDGGEQPSKKILEDELQLMEDVIDSCAPSLSPLQEDADLRQLVSPSSTANKESSNTPTAAEVWEAAKQHHTASHVATVINTSSTDSGSCHGEVLTMHFPVSSPSQHYLDALPFGGPNSHDMLSSVSSSISAGLDCTAVHQSSSSMPPSAATSLFGDPLPGLMPSLFTSAVQSSYHAEAAEHLPPTPAPLHQHPLYTQADVDALLVKQRRELKEKAKVKRQRQVERALSKAQAEHARTVRHHAEQYRSIVEELKALHREEMNQLVMSRTCVLCKGEGMGGPAVCCAVCYQRVTTSTTTVLPHSAATSSSSSNVVPQQQQQSSSSSSLHFPTTTFLYQQHRPH